MSNNNRKRKLDSNDLFNSLKNNVHWELYFHPREYFGDNGSLDIKLIDQSNVFTQKAAVEFQKNDDISLLSTYFPSDSADFYVKKFKTFWQNADSANSVSQWNSDSYFTMRLGVWVYPVTQFTKYKVKNMIITNTIESKDYVSSGNKFFLDFPVRFDLNEDIFKKYQHKYTVYSETFKHFYTKTLFDTKQCFYDNNGLKYTNYFHVNEDKTTGKVNYNVLLHYDGVSKTIDKFKGSIDEDKSYAQFITRYRETFDMFALYTEDGGTTYKIDKFNLFDHIWNTKEKNYPNNYHFIGEGASKKDMRENDWISWLIDEKIITSIITKNDNLTPKFGINFKSIIGGTAHMFKFKKNFTFIKTEIGLDAFKNSPLYQENSWKFNIVELSANTITLNYKLSATEEQLLRLRSGANRKLYVISFRGRDNEKFIVYNKSYLNGFFSHFIHYDANVTLDANIYDKITDQEHVNLLFNPNYKFEVSNIKSTAQIKNSTGNSIQLLNSKDEKFYSEAVDNNGDYNFDIVLYNNTTKKTEKFNRDNLYYKYIEVMLKDGPETIPTAVNNNTALIAYSTDGKPTIVSTDNGSEAVKIFCYFNINEKDIKFTSDGESYVSAVDLKNTPHIEYFQTKKIRTLKTLIKDYSGTSFVGRTKGGIFPARNILFCKNYFRRIDLINDIMNNVTKDYTQDLLIAVSNTTPSEKGEVNVSMLNKIDKNSIKNKIIAMQVTNISLPTKMSNTNDTKMIYIGCDGFAGTTLNIFDKRSVDDTTNKYNKIPILGSVNTSEITDWENLSVNDDRITVSLTHNTSYFLSNYFILNSLSDIQNLNIYLLDEKGNRILYGNTTTKRPIFTISLDFYKKTT